MTAERSETPIVRLSRTIAAPPARVYRAWLESDVLGLVVSSRTGGRHSRLA